MIITMSVDDFTALFRRVSDAPAREIGKLIDELQTLRTQLHNTGDRIQRDIAEYEELSRQIMTTHSHYFR